MTTIKLHNTRTRKKEVFAPLDDKNVRMYVCGPTVYDRAHLGNARPVVVFDVLYRLLRHVYGPAHVTYARNFTDVDDKINARAAESGRSIAEITAETTQWFLEDMGALGALEPDLMPRATQYIPQMVVMIEGLIAKGHAYAAEGHVLFAVESYAAYGALSGRTVEDMIAGARVEVAPYKRNPMDFVLWKPSGDDLPGWESPWGRGRPGWHIECSAMSYELLGESFDIHGGGNDLIFPHHENEIAQSCCAHPEGSFANFWLHNEMLQVEGKKMSKSLGNFFTVRDLLDQGVPGEVIRFVFLSTHYRKPMDWTAEKAEQAESRLLEYNKIISDYADAELADENKVSMQIVEALSNDLNTHLALTRLHEFALHAKSIGRSDNGAMALQLAHDLKFLGIWTEHFGKIPRSFWLDKASELTIDQQALIATLLSKRADAKEARNFDRADEIRDLLRTAGVVVTDTPRGPEWGLGPDFDPAKLEPLK
ncbi:cysteinyl-tRNA synthetase [Roseovarius sp. MBR-79]|jgi:cysteinyl-tRNA synthetase